MMAATHNDKPWERIDIEPSVLDVAPASCFAGIEDLDLHALRYRAEIFDGQLPRQAIRILYEYWGRLTVAEWRAV
jgi:hypothetical protein